MTFAQWLASRHIDCQTLTTQTAQADDLRAEGERRRDMGMVLAAARRPDGVTLGRLALVKALVDSHDGTATIDDATPTAGTGGVAHSNSTSTTTAQGHQSNETI